MNPSVNLFEKSIFKLYDMRFFGIYMRGIASRNPELILHLQKGAKLKEPKAQTEFTPTGVNLTQQARHLRITVLEN